MQGIQVSEIINYAVLVIGVFINALISFKQFSYQEKSELERNKIETQRLQEDKPIRGIEYTERVQGVYEQMVRDLMTGQEHLRTELVNIKDSLNIVENNLASTQGELKKVELHYNDCRKQLSDLLIQIIQELENEDLLRKIEEFRGQYDI